MRTRLVLVGAGGFAGASLRAAVDLLVVELGGGEAAPLGTLFVNVSGCLLLGWLAGSGRLGTSLASRERLLLGVGLLGSWTTLSTHAVETVLLAAREAWAAALLAVGAHVLLGLLALWAGMRLGVRMGTRAAPVLDGERVEQ